MPALGTVLSMIVIGAAICQARELDIAGIFALVPASPTFWGLFALSYFVGPAGDWLIFRLLWRVGANAFGALVRKSIYNEMLASYLGEVYFYGWARKNLELSASPFGAVKDVALLSAIAGNITTIIFFAMAFPFVSLLPVHDHVNAIGWSLAFVISTSLVVMLFRQSLFSLERNEIAAVFAVHLMRIIATTFLTAILWYIILPEIPLRVWLIMATIRLFVFRLPLVPNKDILFAGIAVLALGGEAEISALMALMAGLTLATHALVGWSVGLADLLWRGRSHDTTGC